MSGLVDLSSPPASPETRNASLSPSHEFVLFRPPPVPVATDFIADPHERTKQTVKVLCGNVGIMAESFLILAIGQQGVDLITQNVMNHLDEGFFQLLQLPQSARAKAASDHLKPLKGFMASQGVYLHTIDVPTNALFWKHYDYVFESYNIDTSQPCTLMDIGSTTRSFHKRVELEHQGPTHRESSMSLHYAAMEEAGAKSQWFLLAEFKDEDDKAAVRITEAAAIASLHTYSSPIYTEVLKRYGVVNVNSEAFGCNRTGGMRDWGMKTTDSAVQLVIQQRLSEEYGGERWNFGNLPSAVADWFAAQDLVLKDYLRRQVEDGNCLTDEINKVMGRLGAKACNDARMAKAIRKLLSGGSYQLVVMAPTDSRDGLRLKYQLLNMKFHLPLGFTSANVHDYVDVDFIISDGTHPQRYAKEALPQNLGCRLAILISGTDSMVVVQLDLETFDRLTTLSSESDSPVRKLSKDTFAIYWHIWIAPSYAKFGY